MKRVLAGSVLCGLVPFGVGVASADTLGYGSNDTTATIDCGSGAALDIAGSNNTLAVTGSCSSVRVAGDNNQIAFDAIEDALDITGSGNTVNVKNDNPGLNISGDNNTANTGTG